MARPRSKRVYVRPVFVMLPATLKAAIIDAARADDRSLTSWVTWAVRAALDRDMAPPGPSELIPQGRPAAGEIRGGGTVRMNLELPGSLVDRLAAAAGHRGITRYVLAAALSSLKVPA